MFSVYCLFYLLVPYFLMKSPYSLPIILDKYFYNLLLLFSGEATNICGINQKTCFYLCKPRYTIISASNSQRHREYTNAYSLLKFIVYVAYHYKLHSATTYSKNSFSRFELRVGSFGILGLIHSIMSLSSPSYCLLSTSSGSPSEKSFASVRSSSIVNLPTTLRFRSPILLS